MLLIILINSITLLLSTCTKIKFYIEIIYLLVRHIQIIVEIFFALKQGRVRFLWKFILVLECILSR